MTKKIYSIATVLLSLSLVTGCDTDPEKIELLPLYQKSEAEYAALREWKANREGRPITYAYYAAYAQVEGVAGYKDPTSYGERIIGLPDSLDICALWMGIPSNDPESDDYSPIAYADWKETREKKGTLFVAPSIVRFNKTIILRDGTEYDLTKNRSEEGIRVYAQYLVDQVLDHDLDGLDLDYEPENRAGYTEYLVNEKFTMFVEYCGQYFGPKGIYPDKLLIIDYFNSVPPAECAEYADYYVHQAYGPQGHNGSDGTLDTYYRMSNCPIEKWIPVENFGDASENGGVDYTDEEGNKMTSMEGQARWARKRGAAGFGAFYLDRDYWGNAGPYGYFRKAISIVNQSDEEFESFYE